MNFREIIINVLRTRILPLFTRIRLFLSPNYIRARLSEFFRVGLRRMLSIRPRDKNDYYVVAKWLVSKRLAYAVVIIVTLVCILFLASQRTALFPGSGEDHIKTYRYNSVLLKYARGKVRITGKSKYLAYEGEVSDAACNGWGTLMNPKGNVVYEGNFASSMYEGEGVEYYDDGTLHYDGQFHQNKYSGTGKLYRANGSLEYTGDFLQGMKDGKGKLFTTAGEQVFEGDFLKDEILYSALLGKSSADMAVSYSGKRKLYQEDDERVRFMDEIGAVTEEVLDTASVRNEAVVQAVYVLSGTVPVAGQYLRTFAELEQAFGAATYTGESYATLPEILVINKLNETSGSDVLSGPVEITETDVYTEYTQVEGYDEGYRVWLHSYEADGLVYNFVSNEGDEGFAFYYVVQSDLSDEG